MSPARAPPYPRGSDCRGSRFSRRAAKRRSRCRSGARLAATCASATASTAGKLPRDRRTRRAERVNTLTPSGQRAPTPRSARRRPRRDGEIAPWRAISRREESRRSAMKCWTPRDFALAAATCWRSSVRIGRGQPMGALVVTRRGGRGDGGEIAGAQRRRLDVTWSSRSRSTRPVSSATSSSRAARSGPLTHGYERSPIDTGSPPP